MGYIIIIEVDAGISRFGYPVPIGIETETNTSLEIMISAPTMK